MYLIFDKFTMHNKFDYHKQQTRIKYKSNNCLYWWMLSKITTGYLGVVFASQSVIAQIVQNATSFLYIYKTNELVISMQISHIMYSSTNYSNNVLTGLVHRILDFDRDLFNRKINKLFIVSAWSSPSLSAGIYPNQIDFDWSTFPTMFVV